MPAPAKLSGAGNLFDIHLGGWFCDNFQTQESRPIARLQRGMPRKEEVGMLAEKAQAGDGIVPIFSADKRAGKHKAGEIEERKLAAGRLPQKSGMPARIWC